MRFFPMIFNKLKTFYLVYKFNKNLDVLFELVDKKSKYESIVLDTRFLANNFHAYLIQAFHINNNKILTVMDELKKIHDEILWSIENE